MHPPLLSRLEPCRRVLLVGAGGGYDIFCGLPLYHYLESRGKQVFLASLNFHQSSELQEIRSKDNPRGAEGLLANWLAGQGRPDIVYCFGPGGVQELLGHYQALCEKLDLDALVLVDGGTDSLMRGDEPGLGSPGEDLASLGAAHLLELPTRLLTCLGFGLDAHHHVCHAYALEAAADLTPEGDFLGCFSLLPSMPELSFLADAVSFASSQEGARPSIITGSVVAAAHGKFGDYHVSPRTQGSTMFVNPLMSTYWSFTVDGLARRCLYLEPLLQTRTRGEITQVVHNFRRKTEPRPWLELPF